MNYQNPSHLWSTLIIDQITKSGCFDFFCCPGMRNAPLLYAISKNNKAKAYSGIDERSHAYRALGHIKATGKPAALVCTSGTAVANFLPAIIEAEKSHLPLIVLSADRPGELNATDANQTINQIEILRNYTKAFWNTSEPQDSYPPRALAGKINFLLNQCLEAPVGPIHINIPLREPLDHQNIQMKEEWVKEIHRLLENSKSCVDFKKITKVTAKDDIDNLSSMLKMAKRPLVVFGPLSGAQDYNKEIFEAFINSYKGSFFLDVTSSLKFSFGTENGLIPSLDHPEVLRVLEEKKPDCILHFGHRLTSKHYYGLLSRVLLNSPKTSIVHVSDGSYHEDPGFSFTDRIKLNPAHILLDLANSLREENVESKLLENWEPLISQKRRIIEEHELTYPFITKRAVDTLKDVEKVFIGNSTFIRSFDSYAYVTSPQSHWKILANRGASGIEGHLAMAHSMAISTEKPTASFIGDISFLHDLGSLPPFINLNSPHLCVIANNQGGGIFNLLPISKGPEAESYFNLLTTPHQTPLHKVIASLGLPVKVAVTKEDYQRELDEWTKNPKLTFLEVQFNDLANQDVYKNLKTVRI